MQAKDRSKLLTGVGFERGAAYVQTSAQDGRPFWAEGQVQQIDAWAARHASQIREWFVDLGVDDDTRLPERAGGAQLIEAVRRGEVEFVVVADYDQLGQLPDAILAAIQELSQLKAVVIVVDGEMPPALLMAIGPTETVELKADVELGIDNCSELILN